MTVTLTPGMMGIDISGYRLDTAAKVANAKAAGCRFVLRYSAGAGNHDSGTHWKLITPAEHAYLIRDGFDVIANSEWYETRITEGAGAGKADGTADLALWKSCGHAKGATIYVSWDAAPVSGKWAAVAAYLNAYGAALQGYYYVDIYGGDPVITEMMRRKLVRYGWRPNAGSWSDSDGLPYQPNMNDAAHRAAALKQALAKTPAHIWQTGNYWFSNSADENMILRTPVGSHWDALRGVPTPPPAPKPPAPRPSPVSLHRAWPHYMHAGDYFGLITGGAHSHGGYYAGERPDIKAIQQRLQSLGFAPRTSGWADGKFEQPTVDAVAKWQHKVAPKSRFFGQVWSDDWARLFTY